MDSIKEYLSYYLGCTYYTPNSEGELNAITLPWVIDMIDKGMKVQLVLRKLSSITEQEAIDIYTLERDNLLHPPTDDHDVRKTTFGTIVVRLDLLDIHIHIGNKGQICKTIQPIGENQQFDELRNWPAIFHYLLKQGFWLFGDEAFEKGLIIEKTQ